MAEVLLRHRLQEAGVDGVTVSSAGLYPGGRPATDHGQATVAARGLDLSGHRSRQLSHELLAPADLVVGMAREHVREVAVLAPEALRRTFTLKELVTAGRTIGARRPGEEVAAWLGRAVAGRSSQSLLGMGHDPLLDVADPVGRARADYEETATELDALLTELVALAWPEGER